MSQIIITHNEIKCLLAVYKQYGSLFKSNSVKHDAIWKKIQIDYNNEKTDND